MGLERSARIRWGAGEREIIPHRPWDQNPNAFVSHPNDNWLIPTDIPPLSSLISSYHRRKPPQRVQRGLWYYEAAFRLHYGDLRWSFLVTALEALVHVRKEKLTNGRWAGTTKVFVDRLLHLGALDPTLTVSEQMLWDFYEERSVVAHGQVLGRLDQRLGDLYDQLEEFARRILKKAVMEPTFAACFASDTDVQASLPLRP